MEENEFNENMQVEWVKARARMMRWKEEVLIIQEEMRRVLSYQQWKAAWWKERISIHSDPAITSGISGYAHKQAAICLQMAEQCAVFWLPHLKEKGIVPSWASDFDHLLEVPGEQGAVWLEQDSEDASLDADGDDDDNWLDENEIDTEEWGDDDFLDFGD